jgi:hypothetical protein
MNYFYSRIVRNDNLVGPVRDCLSDRHCGGCSRVYGCQFLVVAQVAGSDRGQTPHVKEAA